MKTVWDDYWTKAAPVELAQIDERHDHYYRLLRALPACDPHSPAGWLLEAGAGTGLRTAALVRDCVTAKAVLLDRCSAALRLPFRHAIGKSLRLRRVQGDIGEYPFGEGTFDFVWNEGVMEHFEGAQRQSVFREVFRILRPGGRYVCIVPNWLCLPMLAWRKIAQARGAWEYGYQAEFTIFELKRRLRSAGFSVEHSAGIDTLSAARVLLRDLAGPQGNRRSRMCPPLAGSGPWRHLLKLAIWEIGLRTAIGCLTGREIGVLARKPGS